MHILSSDQFNKETINAIIELTNHIKNYQEYYSSDQFGKIIATIFYEPSTRTRLSFEAAIHRLGASNISTENAKEMSSAIKGETLKDTIRVLQGY